MTHSPPTPPQPPISRRRLLQALAAAGLTGPLALEIAAQSRGRVSAEILQQASAILGESLSPARLAVTERALQRNLDQFQIVRELAIEDRVEPAPIFNASAAPIPGGAPAPRPRR